MVPEKGGERTTLLVILPPPGPPWPSLPRLGTGASRRLRALALRLESAAVGSLVVRIRQTMV